MTWSLTRRGFLQSGLASSAGLAAAGLVGTPRRSEALEHVSAWLRGCSLPTTMRITDDPQVQAMLKRAVDAAIAAGAEYADARLTHSRERRLAGGGGEPIVKRTILRNNAVNQTIQMRNSVPTDTEEISVGVRAFRNGYWGFASGPVWTLEEGTRLGKEAGRQAAVVAKGKPRGAALAPTEVVTNGKWETPIEIDPFEIHPTQLKDILRGIGVYAVKNPKIISAGVGASFSCQDKGFCSSLGSVFAQRTRVIRPGIILRYLNDDGRPGPTFPLKIFNPLNSNVGAGWEIFDEQRARDAVQPSVDDFEADPLRRLPKTFLDVGRYETVLNGVAVAQLLTQTLVPATQWDRMLGYEANTTGTSYLNEPETMLGSEMVASDLISFSVDRSTPRALATVKWDDEGVAPPTTPIVTRGRLVNLQTNREGAGWVTAAKPEMTVRSSGSMTAPVGVDYRMIHPGNVRLEAGAEDRSFQELVKEMKKGIAITSANTLMDPQIGTGFGQGIMYEVVNGEIISEIRGLGFMFRTPELWKGFRVIGGETSRETVNMTASKGDPSQTQEFTVSAVALSHGGLTYYDPSRKA